MAEPEAYQEIHSPTEPYEVKISGARRATLCRRRILDARLWDGLSEEQQRAAVSIDIGFQSLTRGMGVAPPKYERNDPGRSVNGQFNGYMERYWDWAHEGQRLGVRVSLVLDIVSLGFSLKDMDIRHRKRKGWSKEELHKGLTLYAAQNGWLANRGQSLVQVA